MRGREKIYVCVCVCVCVCDRRVCVCVCVRERERVRDVRGQRRRLKMILKLIIAKRVRARPGVSTIKLSTVVINYLT